MEFTAHLSLLSPSDPRLDLHCAHPPSEEDFTAQVTQSDFADHDELRQDESESTHDHDAHEHAHHEPVPGTQSQDVDVETHVPSPIASAVAEETHIEVNHHDHPHHPERPSEVEAEVDPVPEEPPRPATRVVETEASLSRAMDPVLPLPTPSRSSLLSALAQNELVLLVVLLGMVAGSLALGWVMGSRHTRRSFDGGTRLSSPVKLLKKLSNSFKRAAGTPLDANDLAGLGLVGEEGGEGEPRPGSRTNSKKSLLGKVG